MNGDFKGILHNKVFLNSAVLLLFIVIYRYAFKDNFTNNKIDKEPGWVDAVYFGVSCHSTVGFGDVVPTTSLGRLLTTAHIIFVMYINFVL